MGGNCFQHILTVMASPSLIDIGLYVLHEGGGRVSGPLAPLPHTVTYGGRLPLHTFISPLRGRGRGSRHPAVRYVLHSLCWQHDTQVGTTTIIVAPGDTLQYSFTALACYCKCYIKYCIETHYFYVNMVETGFFSRGFLFAGFFM